MKLLRTFYILIITTLALTAKAEQDQCIVFNDTICDLGLITIDSGYHYCVFEFTNVSNNDVSIIGALSVCGCTIPKYPKEPIHPGEKGLVTVTYDTAGRPAGEFDKVITLITNCEQRHITIHIIGETISLKHNIFR